MYQKIFSQKSEHTTNFLILLWKCQCIKVRFAANQQKNLQVKHSRCLDLPKTFTQELHMKIRFFFFFAPEVNFTNKYKLFFTFAYMRGNLWIDSGFFFGCAENYFFLYPSLLTIFLPFFLFSDFSPLVCLTYLFFLLSRFLY